MTRTPASAAQPARKTVAFVLYPGITLLDLVGPLTVFTSLTRFGLGFEVAVVGAHTGTMSTDTPLSVSADRTYAEVPAPYLLCVPGGEEPTLRALADATLLDYVRTASAAATWTTSVCTGSLILGEAGLLAGRRATTHWMFRDRLTAFGAVPVAERWVEDGDVITAAGVSAGIDMALHVVDLIAGDTVAKAIQTGIEYDPQPPHGPIDWAATDLAACAPMTEAMLTTALADHPALLAKLR
ncbi:DJ-1/PfpI family protein [Streptomyces sp. SID3343]|uniref:DJ-1/PfpI family protein n=1 Tax=Streptomyces sp. SID3343 TaxID=2690260 RepID=UPI0013704394|nr:DJ-1/PfpI family protein [Streptomyces sp. SID3343]MYV97052.1 DJ-1/PfpI family protein [Streptomyces sp. SID3343]